MAADGSDARQVTTGPRDYDGGPFFSPDGKRICFRGFRNAKNPRLANLYVDRRGRQERDAAHVRPRGELGPSGTRTATSSSGRRASAAAATSSSSSYGFRTSPSSASRGSPRAGRAPGLLADGTKLMWTSTRADGRSQIFVADFRLPTEEEWRAGTAEENKRLADAAAASESRRGG